MSRLEEFTLNPLEFAKVIVNPELNGWVSIIDKNGVFNLVWLHEPKKLAEATYKSTALTRRVKDTNVIIVLDVDQCVFSIFEGDPSGPSPCH